MSPNLREVLTSQQEMRMKRLVILGQSVDAPVIGILSACAHHYNAVVARVKISISTREYFEMCGRQKETSKCAAQSSAIYDQFIECQDSTVSGR